MQEPFHSPVQGEEEQFRRVWQRVRQGPEEAAPPAPVSPAPWDPAAFLQSAITQSRVRAASYRRWATLASLAPLTGSQVRRLTAGLFLLSGVRPGPPPPTGGSRWATLEESCRRLWLWEGRAAADYRQAEARAPSPELRALFRELAGECAIQQQRLRQVLEGIL